MPWLYGFGLTFAVGVLAGAVNEKKEVFKSEFIAYALAPIAFKLGSDRARVFAAEKLAEAGDEG